MLLESGTQNLHDAVFWQTFNGGGEECSQSTVKGSTANKMRLYFPLLFLVCVAFLCGILPNTFSVSIEMIL